MTVGQRSRAFRQFEAKLKKLVRVIIMLLCTTH